MLLSALISACATDEGDDEVDAEAVTQEIELEAFDYYFEDTTMDVELNSRVTVDFTNNGESTHAFVVPDLDIDVSANSAETTEIQFETPEAPGLLDFYCKFHPDEMKGTISIGGVDVPVEEQGEDLDGDGDPDEGDPDIIEEDDE